MPTMRKNIYGYRIFQVHRYYEPVTEKHLMKLASPLIGGYDWDLWDTNVTTDPITHVERGLRVVIVPDRSRRGMKKVIWLRAPKTVEHNSGFNCYSDPEPAKARLYQSCRPGTRSSTFDFPNLYVLATVLVHGEVAISEDGYRCSEMDVLQLYAHYNSADRRVLAHRLNVLRVLPLDKIPTPRQLQTMQLPA